MDSNYLNKVFHVLYPTLTWRKPVGSKNIYLTFDDGPIPGLTEYVLDELKSFNIKATFFCVGENVKKHPEIIYKVLEEGHSAGNHTNNHLNGWKCDDDQYLENIRACEDRLNSVRKEAGIRLEGSKSIFRPPYGKIKRSQIKKISGEFDICMWDVLTGDYDQQLSPDHCLNRSIKHVSPGSIVIFHDNIKAEKNLKYALPRFLEHFLTAGYQFDKL
ncbi:MAG: polysaccharide deacetylase family protein [Cytophagaceae bacterium]